MENPKFEELPGLVKQLSDKIDRILKILDNWEVPQNESAWMSVDDLIQYLPGDLSKATIYGYVHFRRIPHKKFGKRLYFNKNEIDQWLSDKMRKTVSQIQEEAEQYIRGKR